MNKQDIKQWFDDNRYYWIDGNLVKDGTGEAIDADVMLQCFNDLQGWVSVDDRLPKIGDKVLIKIPVVNYQNIESAKYKGSGVFVGAWCDSRGRGCTYKVDEWQPLPPSEGE